MSLNFKLMNTDLNDVFLIKREVFSDERGQFSKFFSKKIFKKIGIDFNIKECVYSHSKRNVLRGMHFQKDPFQQSKIVHVIEGEILDVIVKVKNIKNIDKPEFFSQKLSKENMLSIYIPEDYAHGYLTLSNYSIVSYISSSIYDANSEIVIDYNSFGFNWPNKSNLILSDKDKNGINYKEI